MLVPAVAKLLSEDSQRVIVPEWPLNVSVVELVPEQTVALPATVPPSDVVLTVIVAIVLFIELHVLFAITAL